MKFPIFASLIVFCLWLAYQVKKSDNAANSDKKSFWDKEAEANNTRRKSLDNLEYIIIPDSILSIQTVLDNTVMQENMEVLHTLSSQKIVNFTGLTNTELKLRYGAPNINLLTEYDQNYTLLARTLQSFAEALFRSGLISEAKEVLEFAVSTRTDVSQTYFLLADIYEREGNPAKIEELIPVAEALNTVMKSSIVRTLQESGPYSGLLRSL